MSSHQYSIAIFVARENVDTVVDSISSASSAALEGTVVDVLVNGNDTLSLSVCDRVPEVQIYPGKSIRVWSIPLGDKAHAWNQYFHHIWTGEDIAWFIDGYVLPDQNAFSSMKAGLEKHTEVLGATGVPSVGRSAKGLRQEMLKEGGFHGNLCCLRNLALQQIVDDKIYIPLGMYRVDGLVGALLNFGMNPTNYAWDTGRIWVDPNATWRIDTPSFFEMADIRARLKRLLRQAKGDIENRAIKEFLANKKKEPTLFPKTMTELVVNWSEECPEQASKLLRHHPLRQHAYKQLKIRRDWALASAAPKLVYERIGASHTV